VFEPTSRYATVDDALLGVAELGGTTRLIRYKRRRLVPGTGDDATLLEHQVVQGDRLDNLTARHLGDPTLFWRVCDANLVLHPRELTEVPGRVVRISQFGL
jgi:hypothetical protein